MTFSNPSDDELDGDPVIALWHLEFDARRGAKSAALSQLGGDCCNDQWTASAVSVSAVSWPDPSSRLGDKGAKLLSAHLRESDAIAEFLAEHSREPGVHSCLAAALQDARFAFGGADAGPDDGVPKALWLGSLGYLTAVEMIGKYLGKGTGKLRRIKAEYLQFQSAVTDFGEPNDIATADALWELRCVLAHQFTMPRKDRRKPVGNTPQGAYSYRLTEVGETLYLSADNAADNVPTVNVWELKKFVEGMVVKVRELDATGRVGHRIPLADLLADGMFYA